VFVKQLGSNPTDIESLKASKGQDTSEWPDDLKTQSFPWSFPSKIKEMSSP